MGLSSRARAPSAQYRKRKRSTRKRRYGKRKCCCTPTRRRRRVAWKEQVRTEMGGTIKQMQVCKTHRVTSTNTLSLATRTLYWARINDIYKATSISTLYGFAANNRLSNVIDLRGWKVRMDMLNLNSGALWFNWAIVMPVDGQNPAPNYGPPTQDFFRDYTASRDVSFSTALTGSVFSSYDINTDKYKVLTRKRFFIPRNDNLDDGLYNIGARKETNYVHKEFYVPFKRPILFDDDEGDLWPTKHIFAVYWTDFPIATAGTASAPNVQYLVHDIVAYFRDGVKA